MFVHIQSQGTPTFISMAVLMNTYFCVKDALPHLSNEGERIDVEQWLCEAMLARYEPPTYLMKEEECVHVCS